MTVTELRISLLQALYDNPGARMTSELVSLTDAASAGWTEEEVKHALDGLDDAGLVQWEARGESAWRLMAQGQDYLAVAERGA